MNSLYRSLDFGALAVACHVNATPHLRIFVHTLSSAEAVHHQSGMVNPSTKHRKGTSALFPHDAGIPVSLGRAEYVQYGEFGHA